MLRQLRKCNVNKNMRQLLLLALHEAGESTKPADSWRVLHAVMHLSTRDHALGKPLHPHQRHVVKDLEKRWADQRMDMRGLVVMPSGSGKTRTTVDWLLTGPVSEGCKVLWLTHSVYLLEQTAGVFQDQAPLANVDGDELIVRLIGGGHSAGTTLASPIHHVAIATVQSFHRRHTLDHVRAWLKANDVVVVFDEAHHAVAPAWRAPLEMAVNETHDAIIGLTATPTRFTEAGTTELARLFGATDSTMAGAIISSVSADELVEQGVLARPFFHTVDTEFNLEALLTDQDGKDIEAFGDFSPRILSQLVNEAPRNKAIVDAYLAGPKGDHSGDFGQAIVYAVNVAHAETLREFFKKAGVSCEAIFHTRGQVENAESLERFRQKQTRVLVNVEMLTEGVDIPAAEAVLLARPTLSFSLFSQMVGRALRGPKHGGTKYAHIVDFRDLLGRFDDWRVDFSLLKLVDQLPEEDGAAADRGPLVPYDLEALVALSMALSDRHAVPAGDAFRRLPMGYYLVGLDSGSAEGEPRVKALLVFDHDRSGYDHIAREVKAGNLDELRRRPWSRFFTDLRAPRPSSNYLADLRQFVLSSGVMPQFVEFETVDQLSPTAVAQGIVDSGGKAFDDLVRGTDNAYQRAPSVIDRVWGGRDHFARDVRDEWARILEGRPIPVEERRIRSVTLADADEWGFGDGGIDLADMMAGLLSDQTLFPTSLRRPRGGIQWSDGPMRDWAFYEVDTERIVMNLVLNSRAVAPGRSGHQLVQFLLFHELLHHEQKIEARWEGVGSSTTVHDGAFYLREHQFPGFAEHDAFLDDFMRRFNVIADGGR